MAIPQDPIMLLSFINTKLRDDYSSLSDLCSTLDLDPEALQATLRSAGFEYLPSINQFR